MNAWLIARALADAAWVCWLLYLATSALGYAVGIVNTRTDFGWQAARVAFATAYVLVWAITRVVSA